MTAPAGGAAPAANATTTPNDAAAAAAANAAAAATGESSDRGFPADTPTEQMTEAQRTAYWKHHSRRHEDAVKAYKGLTPQQVADLQAENDSLKSEKLTADERTVANAKKEAADVAAATAKAEFLPQIQVLEVKALASTVLGEDKDRLAAFMAIADPSKLVGADGHVDESKVMGHLTAMFGQVGRGGTQQPRWQNAGQYAASAPPSQPGAAGRAEAAKRYGKKT